MYGNEILKLKKVINALLSHEKMKMNDESSAEGLVVTMSKSRRGRSKSRGRGPNRGRSQSKSCEKKIVECFYYHRSRHYKNRCQELNRHLEKKKNGKKRLESISIVEDKFTNEAVQI